MPQKNYLGAIETLNKYQTAWPGHASTLPNYDKLRAMEKYLNRCGIPVEKLDDLSIIHVTGTHGKGSTCLYCESILLDHGYKTGFFSSPHLLEVRERIRVNGKPISKSLFSQNFWEVHDMLDKKKEDDGDMPLYFPLLTVLAFYIFLKSKIDVAIIEVGIGGEFDCTNVIRTPVVVGITPISLDHTAILGVCVESIAMHKAGIMKPGSVSFTVEQQENVLGVLYERSKERECPLEVLQSRYPTDIACNIPDHVKRTVATLAIVLSETFVNRKNQKDIKPTDFLLETAIRSIENACWPGRYDIREVENIRYFVDGAHTQGSIKTTAEWYAGRTRSSSNSKVLVFNLTGKREPEIFLRELLIGGFDIAIFIPNVGHEQETADTVNLKLTPDVQLALCEEYKEKWLEMQLQASKPCKVAKVFPSFSRALSFLGNEKRYDVLITGSLYLVGAVLSVLDPTLNGLLSDD